MGGARPGAHNWCATEVVWPDYLLAVCSRLKGQVLLITLLWQILPAVEGCLGKSRQECGRLAASKVVTWLGLSPMLFRACAQMHLLACDNSIIPFLCHLPELLASSGHWRLRHLLRTAPKCRMVYASEMLQIGMQKCHYWILSHVQQPVLCQLALLNHLSTNLHC